MPDCTDLEDLAPADAASSWACMLETYLVGKGGVGGWGGC